MILLRSHAKEGWTKSKVRKLALGLADFFWECSPHIDEKIEVMVRGVKITMERSNTEPTKMFEHGPIGKLRDL